MNIQMYEYFNKKYKLILLCQIYTSVLSLSDLACRNPLR